MPPRPGTSLEVVRAEAVLEFPIVVLDPPADLRQAEQLGERGAGGLIGEPVNVVAALIGCCTRRRHNPCTDAAAASGQVTAAVSPTARRSTPALPDARVGNSQYIVEGNGRCAERQ